MDVDNNDASSTQTTITQGPSGNNQIIHVRQDSASELEALFNTVMNPHYKSKSLPMKARNLPKSFFMQPDRPRPSPHFHHGHSQSMGGLTAATPVQINHSRSSSSDSNASHTSPAGVTPNSNNNNGSSVSSPGIPPGSPMNGKGYSLSPAQRRAVAHNQFANRSHSLQAPQVVHARSKSSPASLQLMDVANIQVKASDIPHDMPLPPGWSVAKTPDGQQYFMNHNDRSTTWEDPRIPVIKQQRQNQVAAMQSQSLAQNTNSGLQSQSPLHNSNNNLQNDLSLDTLPMGWEQASTPQGEVYYIHHQTRSTSWVDPRLQSNQQNNSNQTNNAQLQQQLMKVNQMDMAGTGRSGGMPSQQQSLLKHLVQEKEMAMRRQLLKQQLSSSGMDPFLGSSNSNFHQRDASLDSGVGMGSNYSLPRTPDDYLGNVEEMDTGDVNRRVHGPQQVHMVPTSNQQQQQLPHVANDPRFPDFLDTLPASSVDFPGANNGNPSNVAPTCPNSTGATLDGNDLVPTLQDTLSQDFDVESMLNHVKTETIDNGMIWL